MTHRLIFEVQETRSARVLCYGKWNSVYVRFRRWKEQGVWDAILATLVEFGLTDDLQHMIGSTQFAAMFRQRALKGDS